MLITKGFERSFKFIEMASDPATEGASAISQPTSSSVSSSGASFGDRFLAGFGKTKQWTLQKVGKATATTESETFQLMIKNFKQHQLELQDLALRSKQLLHINEQVIEFEEGFSSAMAKLGSHSKGDVKASETVQSFVPYTLVLQTHRRKFNEALNELIVKPLTTLLDNEVKKTNILIERLPSARLEYDSRNAALRSLQTKAEKDRKVKEDELKKAESSAIAARATYEATKDQLQAICEIIETRKNQLMQEQLSEYIKAQLTFFDESIGAVKERSKRSASFVVSGEHKVGYPVSGSTSVSSAAAATTSSLYDDDSTAAAAAGHHHIGAPGGVADVSLDSPHSDVSGAIAVTSAGEPGTGLV